MFFTKILWSLLFASARCTTTLPPCNTEAIPLFEVRGLEITSIDAVGYVKFSEWQLYHKRLPVESVTPLDFCNVTLTYTHPGTNDSVNVYILLPNHENWNGRLLGEGGGGMAAGDMSALYHGVALGYATATTDAGISLYTGKMAIMDPSDWALLSPGNVNWHILQNFASRALDDMPKLAKQVVEWYYGRKPLAYWHGCSTGGRQGLMSAQRFPENWDGILAIAPAINWATFLVTEFWPQVVMKREEYWPSPCEFNTIGLEAVEACDQLDGVKDGIIGAPGLCNFDAKSAVGVSYKCGKVKGKVSAKAAKVANDIWNGPRRDGRNEWFGSLHEMRFGSSASGESSGLAMTDCDEYGKNCQPHYWPISTVWIKYFLAKDPEYDITTLTEDDFWRFLYQSRQEYSSIMSTDDPDISEFKAAGGKMILWHGFADPLIFANGSTNYYQEVLKRDPDASHYFRYFEMPGLVHCTSDEGAGAYPFGALEALQNWVEKDIAPDYLEGKLNTADGSVKERIHCPYPQVSALKQGHPDKKDSYECAASFDAFKHLWNKEHSEL